MAWRDFAYKTSSPARQAGRGRDGSKRIAFSLERLVHRPGKRAGVRRNGVAGFRAEDFFTGQTSWQGSRRLEEARCVAKKTCSLARRAGRGPEEWRGGSLLIRLLHRSDKRSAIVLPGRKDLLGGVAGGGPEEWRGGISLVRLLHRPDERNAIVLPGRMDLLGGVAGGGRGGSKRLAVSLERLVHQPGKRAGVRTNGVAGVCL
jgi:hypothetical protein